MYAGLATSFAWDGIETGVRKKPSGMIGSIDSMAKGEASAGDIFDFTYEVGSSVVEGLAGGLGGKAVKGGKVFNIATRLAVNIRTSPRKLE